MRLGWEDPSDDLWKPPIHKPKTMSWEGLMQRLGDYGPRETRAPDLGRQQKMKVRRRDEYQCQRRSCSSRFDLSSPPGELWVEQGRRDQRPRNQSYRQFIGQHLDVHHIVKRENGGQNVPSNLIILCKPCHEDLHNQYGEQVPEWEQFIGNHRGDRDFLGW